MAYERLVRKTTRENLWLYILSSLKEKARYGYELREEIREQFGFEPGEVSAYVVIYALRRDGHIAVRSESPGKTGSARKYYSLTPSGEALLKRAQTYLRELSDKL
jgi:DNA-binding PadR family transcriptional regulator